MTRRCHAMVNCAPYTRASVSSSRTSSGYATFWIRHGTKPSKIGPAAMDFAARRHWRCTLSAAKRPKTGFRAFWWQKMRASAFDSFNDIQSITLLPAVLRGRLHELEGSIVVHPRQDTFLPPYQQRQYHKSAGRQVATHHINK